MIDKEVGCLSCAVSELCALDDMNHKQYVHRKQ